MLDLKDNAGIFYRPFEDGSTIVTIYRTDRARMADYHATPASASRIHKLVSEYYWRQREAVPDTDWVLVATK